jgi:pimeloyl-ACP methyl ester carboxylesterase
MLMRAAASWTQEVALNGYPQFISTIDGVDIHYWHVAGSGPSPTALLLVHGWPGSMYEFHHLIGQLTDPAGHGDAGSLAFDVVIPALRATGSPARHASQVGVPSASVTPSIS